MTCTPHVLHVVSKKESIKEAKEKLEKATQKALSESRVKGIEIIAGKVTREIFDLQKANNRNPEGLDLLVTAPQIYHSNIQDGYGLVTASNDFIISIPE